MLQEPAVHPP
ncbi:hypothetical protein AZE42_05534, partial [Rhizopogon vesiculosus]